MPQYKECASKFLVTCSCVEAYSEDNNIGEIGIEYIISTSKIGKFIL
jgi:hypothetical protein